MTGIVDTKVLENNTKMELRRVMPVAEKYAYFDHAAVSPIPRPAADAIHAWTRQSLESGDIHWMEWAAAGTKLRESAAELLHCTPSEIALVPNTTFGINMVADGLPWNEGVARESVVVLDNEFPSNLLPWVNLQQRGVEVRRIAVPSDGVVSIDEVRKKIDSTTRLVAVSWVGFLSGYRIDLASLCEMVHSAGCRLFVDAIQGLGAFALNTRHIPIDYLAADGHKWMLGPEGAGIFYIRSENLSRLAPRMLGWGSLEKAHQFQSSAMTLKTDASRYEGGSANMAGQIGLSESMKILLRLGCHQQVNPISEAVLDNAAQIETRLRSLGARICGARSNPISQERLSGIIAFQLEGRDPIEIRKGLMRDQIVLSVRHDCLRVATHAYNTHEDIDRLIHSLKNQLRRG